MPTIYLLFMTRYYWKCPRHPVDVEKFVMRWRSTIHSHYHYMVDPELQKYFWAIFGFRVHVQSVLLNLINIGYQLLLYHINQVLPMLKIVTIILFWTLQWLDHHEIIRQQDTRSWVWQRLCINYFRNVD